MKKSTINLIVIAGIVASLIFYFISMVNYGNRMEKLIKAVYEENENMLAQYGNKVIEASQVPDMMRDDLIKVTNAAIGGRYGQDGSKAVFQMLQEHNPNLDSSLYKQIQQIIESGRNNFETGQKKLIDVKRQYETALGTAVGGTVLSLVGYPKINLDDYKIISTDRAQDAFKTKKEAPIKIRQ